jgi:hypothetical protein
MGAVTFDTRKRANPSQLNNATVVVSHLPIGKTLAHRHLFVGVG